MTVKASMPFNRSNFGSAVMNGKIYTAGGYGNYGIEYGYGYYSAGKPCTQPDLNVYDPVSAIVAMASSKCVH
jgi:hypothetical protein